MSELESMGRTKVGIPSTRLPESERHTLMRLAQRGYEVCTKHKAPMLARICDGLALALVSLASAELRARTAEAALRKARDKIAVLESSVPAERFEEPTVTRTNPLLLVKCK